MEIFAGTYEAKIIDYGLSATKSGNQQVVVRFRWNDQFELNWYGSFKEGKGREITLKALVAMGLSSDEVWNLADGPDSGMLDMDKVLSIKVEIERGEDGKDRPKIRWVNELGGAGFRDMMTKAEAVQAFKGMNLKGELAGLIKPKTKKEVEVPF